MKTISLVYISLSGNTESFVTRLKDYLLSQYEGIEVQRFISRIWLRTAKIFMKWTIPMSLFCRPTSKVGMAWITEMLRF